MTCWHEQFRVDGFIGAQVSDVSRLSSLAPLFLDITVGRAWKSIKVNRKQKDGEKGRDWMRFNLQRQSSSEPLPPAGLLPPQVWHLPDRPNIQHMSPSRQQTTASFLSSQKAHLIMQNTFGSSARAPKFSTAPKCNARVHNHGIPNILHSSVHLRPHSYSHSQGLSGFPLKYR